MKRASLGFSLLRYFIGFFCVALLGLLYWSSQLIEEQLFSLKNEIKELKGELLTMRFQSPQGVASAATARSWIDPSLPNLLAEDPFYAKIFPSLVGSHFQPKGIRRWAEVGKPEHFHPFTNWAEALHAIGLCSAGLAQQQFGQYEKFTPGLAIKIEERQPADSDLPEFWVHLRDNIFWQPLKQDFFSKDFKLSEHFLKKHPITAHDFKFYYDVVMNPYVQECGAAAMRTYLCDIEEFRVIDDLTFVVRWRGEEVMDVTGGKSKKIKYVARQLTASLTPLAGWVYQYFPDGKKIIEDEGDPDIYRNNSIWAQNFSQHWAKNIIVSCGPWIFDGRTDRGIRFRRNPEFYNAFAALSETAELEFKETPDLLWQDFKGLKLDLFESWRAPEKLLELEAFLKSDHYLKQKARGFAMKRIDYLERQYRYIGWNEANPLFKSKMVRRALTMAIDRRRIIEQFLNGLGVELTGPFFLQDPAYDRSIAGWPFDLHEARRILEEEGWFDSDGDGILDKEIDGQRVKFSFRLLYFVKVPLGRTIADYVSTALKEIGIDCQPLGLDMADLGLAFESKDFDALYLGWGLGTPPEDPRQLWHSSGALEKGSSNCIGFAHAEVDQIIEKLQYEYDAAKREALYHRFHQIMHDEQPYTFLFTPKVALLYREHVQNVFIPAERQDLVPGAIIGQPDPNIFWTKRN